MKLIFLFLPLLFSCEKAYVYETWKHSCACADSTSKSQVVEYAQNCRLVISANTAAIHNEWTAKKIKRIRQGNELSEMQSCFNEAIDIYCPLVKVKEARVNGRVRIKDVNCSCNETHPICKLIQVEISLRKMRKELERKK